MRNSRILVVSSLVLLAALIARPTALLAQAGSGDWLATRAELESRLQSVARGSASTAYSERLRARVVAEGATIQRRLSEGDFRVGDRIVVRVEGSLTLSDTVTVLEGRRVVLARVGDLSLTGILRSELESTMRDFVRQTVLDATVNARPLVRMAVFGPVTNPGYVAVPMETRLDELLAAAGGPTGEADPATLQVRRGEAVVLDEDEVAAAIVEGRAIGSLGLREGDHLLLKPRSPPWDRMMTLQIVSIFAFPIITTLLVR